MFGLNGYRLDALDEIPRGSMGTCLRWPAQNYVIRGVSLKEQIDRNELAEQLINEILAEERNRK